VGLPHKFEKFILKKLGTIFQPQRYSISANSPNFLLQIVGEILNFFNFKFLFSWGTINFKGGEF